LLAAGGNRRRAGSNEWHELIYRSNRSNTLIGGPMKRCSVLRISALTGIGLVLPSDRVEAHVWLSLAASQQYAPGREFVRKRAIAARDLVVSQMTNAEIERATAVARERRAVQRWRRPPSAGGGRSMQSPEELELRERAAYKADDRQSLEQLCHFITRTGLANERVECNAAGQVVLRFRHPSATAPLTS
jgi:hypothetical protein